MSRDHWIALVVALAFFGWLFRWEAVGASNLALNRWTGVMHAVEVVRPKAP